MSSVESAWLLDRLADLLHRLTGQIVERLQGLCWIFFWDGVAKGGTWGFIAGMVVMYLVVAATGQIKRRD